jgi:hypothetical protein
MVNNLPWFIKTYNNLIEKAKIRTIEGYVEKHHIVSKSLGGSNNKENLVRLTAREHFIAHLLLAKIHGGKMYSAVYLMSCYKRYNSKDYEKLKIMYISRIKGIPLSKETKLKISKSLTGVQQSIETRNKRSASHKGKVCSEEVKKNMTKGQLKRFEEERLLNNGTIVPKKYSEDGMKRFSENGKRNGKLRKGCTTNRKGTNLPESHIKNLRKPKSEEGKEAIRLAQHIRRENEKSIKSQIILYFFYLLEFSIIHIHHQSF